MPRTIDEIRADLTTAEAKAARIHEDITQLERSTEGRGRTAGETERAGRLDAGFQNAMTEINRYKDEWRDALQSGLRGGRLGVENGDGARGDRDEDRARTSGGDLRGRALRQVDALVRSRELTLPDHAAEKVNKLIDHGRDTDRDLAARWTIAAGDVAYRSAFTKLLLDPQRGHLLWTGDEQRAYQEARVVRDMLTRSAMSTAADHGAEMIPLTLDPAIMLTSDGSNNPLRRLARVVQTSTNTWQGVSSAGATAEWKTEAAEAADGSPDVADVPIPVFLGDVNVTYSYEVGMDAMNFLEELSRVMLDAADNLQVLAYTTGNGTTAPAGIVTGLAGTSSEINTTGSETYDDSDPYALQNALPARFSANAVFMAHIATMNAYRQMETTNGSILFPELRQNPPMLLGKPFHENSNMDGSLNAAATANNYVMIYGDIRAGFTIVDRIGSTLEILPAYGANRRPTAQRHAFMTFRTGSKVVVPQALRLLDVPTTA